MMVSGYSFAAWKAYCADRVRPQHLHDRDQLARMDRLLKPDTAAAWEKFADDVTTKWPAHLEPLTWPEALHNVIGTLVFPPTVFPKPDTERDARIIAARAGRAGLPLIPAMRGRNAQRNWVALYLKTWIVPGLFTRKHYEEIAALVEIAWGSGDGFSPDQVRLIRPFHFRKSYRQKTG